MFSKKIKYQVISNATHFSFMQICRPKAMEILAKENEEFVCIDGGKKSRQELHDEIYDIIEKFIHTQNITSTSTRTNYSLAKNRPMNNLTVK